MGVEQKAESTIAIPVGPLRIRIGEDVFVKKMVALEERIYRAIDVSFEPQAMEEIMEDAQEGYFLAAYANHTSLYDGRPLGKAVKRTLQVANSVLPEGKQYQGFVVPVATSIKTGDQHPIIKKFSESTIEGKIGEDGLLTVSYTRRKDQEKYRLPANLLEFIRKMKGFIQDRYGLVVFPEATVQGGRRNPRGGINGMQPFEEKTIETMAKLILNEGYTPSFIPIGIWGSHKVLSPDTLRPTIPTIIQATLPSPQKGIVKVRIGSPIRWDDFMKINGTPANGESINDFFARELAPLVPKSARGVYRNAV